MKAFVVCYSLSGTTRAVATAFAKELGAGIEEMRCGRYTASSWGFIRAASDCMVARQRSRRLANWSGSPG